MTLLDSRIPGKWANRSRTVSALIFRTTTISCCPVLWEGTSQNVTLRFLSTTRNATQAGNLADCRFGSINKLRVLATAHCLPHRPARVIASRKFAQAVSEFSCVWISIESVHTYSRGAVPLHWASSASPIHSAFSASDSAFPYGLVVPKATSLTTSTGTLI